uniref:Sorting nexin 11 n=1 Tax=Hippocampus comes TaxID=109280 RepID=A0A3Q2XEM5_HIPCM
METEAVGLTNRQTETREAFGSCLRNIDQTAHFKPNTLACQFTNALWKVSPPELAFSSCWLFEFVAVRVQDPRVQNEGLWNSYVDYKIFLHTNSKAFTAKTSCVRRRYSEFHIYSLASSFFSFSNEDFLERRRQGLQVFLDKVVNMTVCLSDSQLHLFLQTQLPVGHILDCVQGHTPYSVTDAILTYASSNRGWAQAQEEDAVIKEPSLNVSYESMER